VTVPVSGTWTNGPKDAKNSNNNNISKINKNIDAAKLGETSDNKSKNKKHKRKMGTQLLGQTVIVG
jgi:hypothetical protein